MYQASLLILADNAVTSGTPLLLLNEGDLSSFFLISFLLSPFLLSSVLLLSFVSLVLLFGQTYRL
jgi:hypothetical protein